MSASRGRSRSRLAGRSRAAGRDGPQVRSGYGDIGARCSFAGGGTATLAGQRLNCGCDNGGYLYGYPNKTAAVWTISYAAPGSGASVSTPITTVYE